MFRALDGEKQKCFSSSLNAAAHLMSILHFLLQFHPCNINISDKMKWMCNQSLILVTPVGPSEKKKVFHCILSINVKLLKTFLLITTEAPEPKRWYLARPYRSHCPHNRQLLSTERLLTPSVHYLLSTNWQTDTVSNML